MSDDVLQIHYEELMGCERCPLMFKPVVSGKPVMSKVMLVGQAPGIKEPIIGKPFAWTAGKTLFKWFREQCGVDEESFRNHIYMAAVCRCFPGKSPTGGGDRVPNKEEIANCSEWLRREIEILKPELILPVGKLAILQFMNAGKLDTIIGNVFRAEKFGHTFDLIPLPHPSGASPWSRIEPGKTLLRHALAKVKEHPSWVETFRGVQ